MTEFQPMPEANDRLCGPALAVCQAVDGTYIAWWGKSPVEGWEKHTRRYYPDGGGFTAPVTIGERRAVREEWAQSLYRFSDGKQSRSLAYRSDGVVGCVSADGTFVFHGYLQDWHRDGYRCFSQSLFSDWQPADTMPDWAVRKHQRCVSRVPVQACNVTEEQAAAMACYDPASGMTAVDCFLSHLAGKWPNIDEGVDSRWGWLITWEDDNAN